MNKRITVELTEDQAEEIITHVAAAADKAYWLDVDDPVVRKRGREIAQFRTRIVAKINAELAKS